VTSFVAVINAAGSLSSADVEQTFPALRSTIRDDRKHISRGLDWWAAVSSDQRGEVDAICETVTGVAIGHVEGGGASIARSGLASAADLMWSDFESLGKLNGSFGFVTFDRHTQIISIVRDPFGVVPLYYTVLGDYVAVSTSALALVHNSEYDRTFLANFLVGYLDPDGPSIFKNVNQAPPGAAVEIRARRQSIRRFWSAMAFAVDETITLVEAADKLRSLLIDAVTTAMATSSQVWAELSGGIDSSSIVSLAQSLADRNTISRGLQGTVTYADSLGAGDERDFVTAVLTRYKVANTVIKDGWMWMDDGEAPPLTDTPRMFYPFYASRRYVDRLLHRMGVKVLLTGLGPDHYLMADRTFLADMIAHGRLIAFGRELVEYSVARRSSLWEVGMRNGVTPLLPTAMRRTLLGSRGKSPAWLRSKFVREFDIPDRLPRLARLAGPIGRKFQYSVAFNLSGLVGQLTNDSSSTVDVRHPFLYRPLVEFGLCLPPQFRSQPGKHKLVLRQALEGILPKQVADRTGKGGMSPRFAWSLSREHRRIEELLTDPILADLGCISASRLRQAVEGARSGKGKRVVPLLSALALETWLRVRAGRWTVRSDMHVRDELLANSVHEFCA
jgi:asparagine synthase (glutamine-hydrolysing)